MAIRSDLLKKGIEALQGAEHSLDSGNHKDAEIEIAIANSYARLAEALGDKVVTVRSGTGYNW